MRGMPLARTAQERLDVEPVDPVVTVGIGPDLAATRRLAARVVAAADPGSPASAGELAAIGLLHEVVHRLVTRLAVRDPDAAPEALARRAAAAAGSTATSRVRRAFDTEFPNAAEGEPIAELILVHVANENPAASPYRWLFDDRSVVGTNAGTKLLAALEAAAKAGPAVGPGGLDLLDLLRAPARASPTSLSGQLRYVRDNWRGLLGGDLDDLLDRVTLLLDVITEEERGLHQRFGGAAAGGEPPGLGTEADPERFSEDREWMPRVVLLAKSTYVWLDQLSRQYGREIRSLDAVPDEELDRLAHGGVTGLWLIGLWQRSQASETIKRWRGDSEAVASAYSLDDYRIADDLGGEGAWADLARRAWSRGIRLASDMVANHMGIDSRWVIEHPDRFLSLPEPPFPSYTFGGRDLSPDPRAAIRIEDHYWDDSDAAVVFQRIDTATGETRYIYHGNDGTSTPWNDTAQFDYSQEAVREAVIQTILAVARRFPIIRFDAAMTLAKRHVQRLWFPPPGSGGGIPSRAEHTMSREAFEAAMPREFWRDVVDRVAAEVPDTLLLAEAFWLMEGYFVRTLGMHRVYNSAFMHMLRDEDGAGYHKVLRDTLEFDRAILQRYVNFMSNPDEETAIEQFGVDDKYLGVATMLATLPGLPMLGHGQIEGYTEKYGMEYRRPRRDEVPNDWLVERHERWLFPLFHRRAQFAGAQDFLLYDVVGDDGTADPNVFAYSNGTGPGRSLVIYHNRYASTAGWLRDSIGFAASGGGLQWRSLADGWGLPDDPGLLVRAVEHANGLEHLWRVADIRERGLRVELGAYGRQVYLDVAEVRDDGDGRWSRLADRLAGGGVPSLERALRELELEGVHAAIGGLLGDLGVLGLIASGSAPDVSALAPLFGRASKAVAAEMGRDVEAGAGAVARGRLARLAELAAESRPIRRASTTPAVTGPDPLEPVRSAFRDPGHRAILAAWSLLDPMLGGRALTYDDLLLAPVVAGAFGHAGLDEAVATRAAARVGQVLGLARPSEVADGTGLVEALVAAPASAALIGLNSWDGSDWVSRDGWRETLDWSLLLDVVDGADPAMTAGVILELAAAGETGGYRLDRIRSLETGAEAEGR